MGSYHYSNTGKYLGRTETDADRKRRNEIHPVIMVLGLLCLAGYYALVGVDKVRVYFGYEPLMETRIEAQSPHPQPRDRAEIPEVASQPLSEEAPPPTVEPEGTSSPALSPNEEHPLTQASRVGDGKLQGAAKFYPPCSEAVTDSCVQSE